MGAGERVAGGVGMDVGGEDEQEGMEGFTEGLRDSPHQVRERERECVCVCVICM